MPKTQHFPEKMKGVGPQGKGWRKIFRLRSQKNLQPTYNLWYMQLNQDCRLPTSGWGGLLDFLLLLLHVDLSRPNFVLKRVKAHLYRAQSQVSQLKIAVRISFAIATR